MNIIADENMPYVRELFAGFGDVCLSNGRQMDSDRIVTADVLLVRSITQVNAGLLEKSPKIRFVGSATAGVEHLDIPYLEARGIQWAHAPGCNSLAVSEYVLAALLHLSVVDRFELRKQSIAIIGAGHAGTAVAGKMSALGMDVLLCDPPLERAGDPRSFVTFSQALAADIVSLQVPLTDKGEHKTWHLLDEVILGKMRSDQYLINTSRGAVIDNPALLQLKRSNRGPRVVLDVWEGEPDFVQALLPHVCLATPHIAGYSLEGKARGTWLLYRRLCKHLQIAADIELSQLLPVSTFEPVVLSPETAFEAWQQLLPQVYDIKMDDQAFRLQAPKAGGFDQLRKSYRDRREFSALAVHCVDPQARSVLAELGFSVLQNGA